MKSMFADAIRYYGDTMGSAFSKLQNIFIVTRTKASVSLAFSMSGHYDELKSAPVPEIICGLFLFPGYI